MLGGTSAAMLVGTSAPETYSKFGLHLCWLARVTHACWYVRRNACWYVLEKNFSVPFRCLRRSLALRNFFPFYVLPEEGGERERGGERGRERERGGKRRIELLRFCRSREKNEILRHAHAVFGGTLNCASFINCASMRARARM